MTSSGNFFPYTYVQYAWWRTEAGGNASDIQSTPFSKEAEAFAAYINKVAKRDQSGNIVYEEKTVTINGETTTVQAPVIEYAVTGDISKSDVQYDKDHEKFLIGPITLNYYEESVETERGKVDFAGMTDAKIISNIGEIDKSHWFFKFTNRNSDDKTAFPHNGEEFYIVLDYMEDLRYLSDISFDFKYMNAGGEYSELKGEYFTADWEPESEAVWCDENPSSTKKCSHGYNNKHIVQWNYWVELKGLKPGTSQPLAQVYKGARWYEDAHISLKAILPPDEDEPKEFIRLTIPMAGEVWIDKKADKKKKKNNPFKSVAAFFKSTNAERKKVVWPSAKDTIKNAAIVLAVTLVVGVAIYGIDSLLTLGMKQVKSLADNTTVSAEADDSSNPDADIVEDDAESTTAAEDTTAESTSAE